MSDPETIRRGRDALRYLLNFDDAPRTTIGTLLDKTMDARGCSVRQRLEWLWEALDASHRERCPRCRMDWQMFPPVRFEEMKKNGKFGPGNWVRCVECKDEFLRPEFKEALPTLPSRFSATRVCPC